MKTLKLFLLGIFAFLTPVLFYVQAVKLADVKVKQNTSDTIIIKERYEHQLSIIRLKYSDSLKSKEIEYLNRLLALNKNSKPVVAKINLSNIESLLNNIKSTLDGINGNTKNTNISISDLKSSLYQTNKYLFQIDSLIKKEISKSPKQAVNSIDTVKNSNALKLRQIEMNSQIDRLRKTRNDILLLRESLRKSVLRRLRNKKDSTDYFGLENIDSLQKSIINSPYKLYFELNK